MTSLSAYPRALLFVALSILALVAVACGGATTPTATPTKAAAPAATATATPATTTSPSTTGAVQVMVTDAPPSGVTAIVVTASKIEAHRAGAADDSGWDTLVSQPVTFDLVKVTGVEQLLGSQTLPVGHYTQVRFSVDKTVVTYQGTDKTANVPSDKVRVVGEFDVTQGETTVLTLDFDADKSVVITGQGNAQLKPTLKLLVRKGSNAPAKTPTPTPGAATPGSTTTPPASTPAKPSVTPAAQTGTPTGTATTPSTNAAQRYSGNCAACHGANRQGGFGPALTPSSLSNLTVTQIANTIANGKGSMPAFSNGLTQAEINALADWLKNTSP